MCAVFVKVVIEITGMGEIVCVVNLDQGLWFY